jgi:peptide/nickel transport system permease protein
MSTQAIAAQPIGASSVSQRGGYLWYAVRKSRSAQLGIVLMLLVLLAAVLGPLLWQVDPAATEAPPLAPPSLSLPFGSDQYGRDLFSRVLNGLRLDLAISVFVAALATTLGAVIGVLVGYLGGGVEQGAMRVTDVMLAFPGFILALAIAAFLGNDIRNVILALTIAYTPVMVRLVRGQALSLRSSQFILASRTMGAPAWWIVLLHMLPNTLSPILVQATLFMAWAVLDTAGLSFIGVGIAPPTPELGSITGEGASYLVSGSWWYAVLPGIVIMLVVLAFNLLGDAARDVLDPHAD